jgi:hypothetical protein
MYFTNPPRLKFSNAGGCTNSAVFQRRSYVLYKFGGAGVFQRRWKTLSKVSEERRKIRRKSLYTCVFLGIVVAQKTKMAAPAAAGAGGGPARQQNRAPEWYTIVVYEKPRAKKVVLYVERKTYVFSVPADVNIGNIAVIMKRWLAGGKTPAYSASIHVENLAELLRAYAPDVAEHVAPVLRVAEVVAYADGAQPEAYIAATPRKDVVCGEVNELINVMRSAVVLAIRMDEFVVWVNRALRRSGEAVEATAEDVKGCIRYDPTVKVVETRGAEVLWLWESYYYYELVEKATRIAQMYRSVLAEPDNTTVAELQPTAEEEAAAEDIREVVNEIRLRLEDALDSRTAAYVYEHEKGDRRFNVVEVAEGEFFMKICGSEEEGCVEVALTVAEAIALALRLIRYAAEAYQKEKAVKERL